MEDARNVDFHFQFLYWMKIKWTKTTRTEEPLAIVETEIH